MRWLMLSFLLLASGCDCEGPTPSCGSDDECELSEQCVDGRCQPRPDGSTGTDAGRDAGPGGMDAGPECVDDSMCSGGVCLNGTCCGSVDDVCGDVCCGDGMVCFGSACVMPGDTCVTNRDCADGEYCEPSLGDAPTVDAGMPDGGMSACGSVVGAGRCIALPPSCDEVAPGEPCISASCEFRPPVGLLDAVPQWRWDPTTATEEPTRVDVWSTPVVGRLYDVNCDGAIDELDPSAIVFVSNDVRAGACHGPDLCRRSILRALDGASGRELWSLPAVDSASVGFAGVSLALGDLDDDGVMDIVAVTGERRLAAIAGDGTVMAVGTDVLPATTNNGLGWGGGLALADMEGDGHPEVAWRGAVYTWRDGNFSLRWNEPSARGGWAHGTVSTSTSFFVNLDSDPDLELLSGRTAMDTDGSILWQRTDLTEGFAAVGDFDMDGTPEVVLVGGGQVTLLEAATGNTVLGPVAIGGTGAGGPPTVADFDGDGAPEIGVAQATVYAMLKPDFAGSTIDVVWTTVNHDNSSSVTGSTVFDFEGDGVAEVVYNDECYMWVYDGPTGNVRFSASTNSFTGTEASLVADVDGDGHAEMVMISTGANPDSWHCNHHMTPSPDYPAWSAPSYGRAWRGISVFRDSANAWVGTRSLWTQHAYHVTNTCDDGDSACDAPNTYGAVPTRQRPNWSLPWLNNFRQNVQEGGIFDAPDAVLDLRVVCSSPVRLVASLRNQGRALLPAGVEVEILQRGTPDRSLGTVTSSESVFPGRVLDLELEAPADVLATDTFYARIVIDPATATFRECREDNNESGDVTGRCLE